MVIFAGLGRNENDLTFYPLQSAKAVREFIQKNARGIDHFIFSVKEDTALVEHLLSFGQEHNTDSTKEG
jgi:hypothetical protein